MGIAELYLGRSSMVFGGIEARPEDSVALIIGIPYDFTSSYRPGSRFAPQAIRLAASNIEFYSLRASIDVDDYRISDLGDLSLPINPRDALRRIEEVIYEVISQYQDKLLIILGGEHTLTIASYSAAKRINQDTCLLVFDAHFDLRDKYMEDPFSHACVMRRIIEKYGASNAMVIGVRAFTREELDYARERGLEYITPIDVRLLGIRGVVSRAINWIKGNDCKALYISIDMDVFDPAYAPGVGNPEPEGLEPWHVLDTIYKVVRESGVNIAVADLVEVTPLRDCNDTTSILAAKIAVELTALRALSARVRRH